MDDLDQLIADHDTKPEPRVLDPNDALDQLIATADDE